uniref:NADH-ubiquinone oxidoreductase chain 2 n=1 Tax=Neotriplax arisana TaxID=2866210 RepID=A0A8F9RSL2_9CUCU|nr:NADH dehydrogenase subunit 2 [Neotriplax arisana]
MLFLNIVLFGSLLSISSYSWLSMWMGLEINLLSIIPLISKKDSIYPAESAMKYFLTQTMASIVMMFSIVLSLNIYDITTLDMTSPLIMILNSSLFIKMGAAPFHFWFPEILDGLNWLSCLIMLTWQKIAPMVILMFNIKMSLFILMIILTSTIIGSLMSLNQISLRKILAYSSINHIGWMIASMMVSNYIWIIYFLIYSIISINIVLIFNNMNIFYMKQLFKSLNKNKLIKYLLMLNFLSLGGLPPFIGFYPKWLTINFLVEKNFIFLSIILIIFTMITLFVYLRVTFYALTINVNETVMSAKFNLSFYTMMFNLISLSLLFMCPLMFNFI